MYFKSNVTGTLTRKTKTTSVTALALLAGLIISVLGTSAQALDYGDKVTLDALKAATPIRGKAPEKWEEGKVYMLECWATWCGPCIQAMPHVEALHQKYKDKGLEIIGMNVYENGQDKASNFLEQKGDELTIPVLYVGRGGDFEKEWLTPLGVTGIPHSMIVKDGVVLAGTHPMNITDEAVEAFIEGGEKADAMIEQWQKEAQNRKLMGELQQKMFTAYETDDLASLKEVAAKLREIDSESPYNKLTSIMIMSVGKQWDEFIAFLDDPDNERLRVDACYLISQKFDDIEGQPNQAVLSKMAKLFGEEANMSPMLAVLQARALVKMGKKDEAKTVIKTVLDSNRAQPKEAYQAFYDQLEADNPMTLQAFTAAMQAR